MLCVCVWVTRTKLMYRGDMFYCNNRETQSGHAYTCHTVVPGSGGSHRFAVIV